MTTTASISAGPLADEVVYAGERAHGQVMDILITNGNDHQWSSRRRKRKTKNFERGFPLSKLKVFIQLPPRSIPHGNADPPEIFNGEDLTAEVSSQS